MTSLIVVVFGLVYAGMFLGGLPALKLDRTGVALLGAIVLVASGAVDEEAARDAVHVPTLALLFAFMVVSAQLRLAGFYGCLARSVAALPVAPPVLLGVLIFLTGTLAAIFSNDIVCLAMAPVVADLCSARRLDPRPFLLGLACSANVGSAATLIGNPQNRLIGETLGLSFPGYLRTASVPVVASLGITWALTMLLAPRDAFSDAAGAPERRTRPREELLDPWQTAKGLAVTTGLCVTFLLSSWPRDLLALGGAGVLLTSRRLHSRRMLGLVDWELLVLFSGLFVVHAAMDRTGLSARAIEALAGHGLDVRLPEVLFVASFLLSNLVSNVPAVMLLLPVATHPDAGVVLALSSTFAGNLLVVGSIANIIVIQAAERRGIPLDWRAHARVGVPVTLTTSAVAAASLWIAR